VKGLVAAIGLKTSRDLYQKVTFVPDHQFVRRSAFAVKNETIRPFGRNSTRDCARFRSKFHTRLHADVKMKRFGLFSKFHTRLRTTNMHPFKLTFCESRKETKHLRHTVAIHVRVCVCARVCTHALSLSHTHICIAVRKWRLERRTRVQNRSGKSRFGW